MGKTTAFFRACVITGLAVAVMGWMVLCFAQIQKIGPDTPSADLILAEWLAQKKGSEGALQSVLNEKYATHLESTLTHLLEQITGKNSVKVVVNAWLENENKERVIPVQKGFVSNKTQRQNVAWQSVGVLIDGYWTKGKGNGKGYRSRSRQEMALYEKMVQTAMGFNAQRGDQVMVLNLPFAKTKGAGWMAENKILLIKSALLSLGFFLSFLLLLYVIGQAKNFNDEPVKTADPSWEGAHLKKLIEQEKFEKADQFLSQFSKEKKDRLLSELTLSDIQKFSRATFIKTPGAPLSDIADIEISDENQTVWDRLQNVPEEKIVSYLQQEYPQTIAVILYHFTNEKAAHILSQFPSYLMWDVLLRLASLEKLQPDTVRAVEKALQEALKTWEGEKARKQGQSKLADILMQMTPSDREKILKMLSDKSPTLAENLSGHVVRFCDLAIWDGDKLKKLIKSVSKKDLVLSLKGSSQEVKNAFAKNMNLQEWLILIQQVLTPDEVPLTEIDKAQQRILAQAQKLEKGW